MTDTAKQPDPLEPERIREVTRIVLSALKEWQEGEKEPAGLGSRALDWINSHWAIVAALIAGFLSILYLFLAWKIYEVDFLHPVAKIAYEQKKSKKEIEEYQQKEKERGFLQRIVECRLTCGKEFLNAGLDEEAKKEFEAAQNLDKTNTEAQLGLLKSRVFELSQGEYNPEVIEKRINFIENENKNDPHIFLFRGKMYYALQKYGEAEKNLKKAIDLDGKVASAHYYLGLIYDKNDNPDEALKEFELAVKQSKWNRSYLNNLASVCFRKGRYGEAIEKYEEVITLDPRYLLPYAEISRVLRLTAKEAYDVEKLEIYQRTLLIHLEGEIASSKNRKGETVELSAKNAKPWFFCIEGNKKIYLYSPEEKQGYAHYNLAVTLYLLNKESQAFDLVSRGPKLLPGAQLNVMTLVEDEVSRLDKERPDYRDRIKKIKQELFPQMQQGKKKVQSD